MLIAKIDSAKLARIMKTANDGYRNGTPAKYLLEVMEWKLANCLELDNPLFSRAKFIKACGG